jgi:hypothetical protein
MFQLNYKMPKESLPDGQKAKYKRQIDTCFAHNVVAIEQIKTKMLQVDY